MMLKYHNWKLRSPEMEHSLCVHSLHMGDIQACELCLTMELLHVVKVYMNSKWIVGMNNTSITLYFFGDYHVK